MKQNFLGKWHLIPEKSEYAKGTSPGSAVYEFAGGENDSLDVSVRWTDAEENDFEIGYNIITDGQRREYENPEIADEVMSEFESDFVLNTSTYKGNQKIAFASRTIDKEGIMKVVQRFFAPDGTYFDNVQYYRK